MSTRISILPIAFSLLLGSCSADEALPRWDLGDETISFNGEMLEGNGTKGQVPLRDSTLFTMGVFAGYENEDEYFSSSSPANDFISNVRYTRSFIYHPFSGDDVCYWPFVGKLSFFAYAPYVSDTYLKFASDYVSGFPRFSYSPTEAVTSQPDFCIATPVLNQRSTASSIPLVFHHTLSQLMFSANYSGSMPAITSSLYIKIDSIRICNVIGRKMVSVSNGSPCFTWQADTSCTASDRTSYLLQRGGGDNNSHITNSALPQATTPPSDNYLNMSTANGRMYLLPQSMAAGELYLQVSYGYYEMVGTAETLRSSVTTTCPLPAVTWNPAGCYRYKFTINLATSSIVNPTVTVEAWNDVNNTGSNPQHIE